MASFLRNKTLHYSCTVIFLTTLISLLIPNTIAIRKYESIISFGDSLTDTGNLARLVSPSSPLAVFLRSPYGETYFHHPSGRWSDGRLIIDFMAQEFGLPFIPPYHGSKISNGDIDINTADDFRHGMNFAVAGATALGKEFFDKYDVSIPFPDASLTHQLSWFKEKFLPVICAKPQECKSYLKNALFLVGEIGGNDYNNAFFPSDKSMDVASEFIPHVVKKVGSVVTELIKLGAETLMVPGNFPIGCTSKYLTAFQTHNINAYNPTTGCLDWINKLSVDHNEALQIELDRIQNQYPNVTVTYLDYYGASMHLYLNPTEYGFSKFGGLYTCCGGEGPYNVSLDATCGAPGTQACPDPSLYVCWDGLHYTDAANKYMTKILLDKYLYSPALDILGDDFSVKSIDDN